MIGRSLRISRALPLVCVAALFSCRGCQRVHKESVLDFVAQDSSAVIHMPDVHAAQTKLEAFVARATRGAGSGMVLRVRDGFKTQFGFDPLVPGELKNFGIRAEAGLALFAEGADATPILAMGISDPKKADAFFKSLISTLESANTHTEEKFETITIHTASRPFGTEAVPSLHWAYLGDYALIARGGALEGLKSAISRNSVPSNAAEQTGPQHIAQDPIYQELLGKVDQGQIHVFVRGEGAAPWSSAVGELSRGVMTSVRVGAEGLSTDIYVDTTVPGLAEALSFDAVYPLTQRLQGDAAIALMSRAASPKAWEVLRNQQAAGQMIEHGMRPVSKAIHLNFEKDVVPLLKGPLTVSVYIKDLMGGIQAWQQGRNVARLLDALHVVITAEVEDGEKMNALLQRNKDELIARGISVQTRSKELAGHKATIFEPGKNGEKFRIGWAMWNDVYVYAAGEDRLDTALAFLAEPEPAKSLAQNLSGSVAQQLAQRQGATVGVLRLSQLAKEFSHGKSGDGLAGFGVDMMLKPAVNLLSTLGDVALSFEADGQGMAIKMRQALQ